MPRIRTEKDLASAAARLMALDPRLAPIAGAVGALPLRLRPPGFKSLIAIVVDQQISRGAATAIFSRLEAVLEPFTPQAWLDADEARLARAGLSGPKRRHARAIAHYVADGRLNLKRLSRLSDERARALLMTAPGIGRWTADIYLLTCLGRSDIWPAGDLALQTATAAAFANRRRLNEREMDALAESWRPWRGVAARMLWAHYRALKAKDADS